MAKLSMQFASDVIRNLKQLFKAKYGTDTVLSDETILDIYNEWYGVEDDYGSPQDEIYVEEMKHAEDGPDD